VKRKGAKRRAMKKQTQKGGGNKNTETQKGGKGQKKERQKKKERKN
jgi:hypothetical protein